MEDQFNLTADRIDASQACIQRRLVLTANIATTTRLTFLSSP